MFDETLVPPAVTKEATPIYLRPAFVCELNLETRAGSPLGGGTLIDPLGLDPTQPD